MSAIKRYLKIYVAIFVLLQVIGSSTSMVFEEKLHQPSQQEIPISPTISDVFDDGIIYSGIQNSLEINETAIYTEESHFNLGNGTYTGYESQIAEYPLDEANGWEAYRYSANLTNILDERDWVKNGGIGSDFGITPSSRIYEPFGFIYGINEKRDTILHTFDGSGCDYMRLHFINITVQGWFDNLYIWNEDTDYSEGKQLDKYSGTYPEFVTPWYSASQLKVSMKTDNSIHGHFFIDYFETYSGSIFESNMNNWTSYGYTSDLTRMNATADRFANNSAVKISMKGFNAGGNSFTYYLNDESGIYQEVTAPRGKVVDAWISVDFLLKAGLKTDDIYLFYKIDDEIIYTRGFRTITQNGLAKWQSSGLINLDYWENQSTIFDGNILDQTLNISVGIQSGSTAIYQNVDHVDVQQLFIDNIKIILKAEANATQTDIQLLFNDNPVTPSENMWGEATYTQYSSWTTNPIQVVLTANATKLEFDLESAIYGYHINPSEVSQYGTSGTTVTIYTNSSIQWKTYHNVFIPLDYSNYKFTGNKPVDWDLMGINDPLGRNVGFQSGLNGNSIFSVEYPQSSIPGWWLIRAFSTNMIDSSLTEIGNGTHWQHYLTPPSLNISDAFQIRTHLITSLGNIGNNASTWANLVVYDPNGIEWYSQSVHPQISGLIEFPELTIGALNTTGGVYDYSITWMNGTSAGGLNGSFQVTRDIQYSLLYPRDAISDLTTEEVLGDIIPIRLILNDSITGVKQSNLHIDYAFSTGGGSLVEISQGIYDGSLDSAELGLPGYHEVNFTIWGIGYNNATFNLGVNLVEETNLKIVGLDNNIDYGSNFSMQVRYSSKNLGFGIDNATIGINLSSSHHFITPETDGTYTIEISSNDAFSGAGSYDIEINASKVDYEFQEIITRIQILPRSVYFKILINSTDCSLNKSYQTHVKQNLNFSIGVYSSAEDIPVLGGTVYLTDGIYTSESFSLKDNYYTTQVNSSNFGLGVHFISIIFNETDYQSAAEIVMLTITKLQLNASLYNTEQILSIERNSDFEVSIYVEDPLTHTPIIDANISYSWSFGQGYLTNLGGGYYKFTATCPRVIDSYIITFTIISLNTDYEIDSITITLISRIPETVIRLWWFLVPVGIVAIGVSTVLGVIMYKQKVQIPKREQEVKLLKKKTQIFDDIINIKSILIIETNTGRLMFRHILEGLDNSNEDIFSGFLHAILSLSNKFALKGKELGEKREYAEFTHEIFHVLVASGQKVIIALILEEESSPELQQRAFKFIDEFEGIYASVLENWSGDRNVFKDTTPKLFEEIFHLSLLKRFTLTKAENLYLIEKVSVIPGTISERVANIIKTVSEERTDFLLKTLIFLVPEEDQLQAKDTILRFIKNKYLVPVD